MGNALYTIGALFREIVPLEKGQGKLKVRHLNVVAKTGLTVNLSKTELM